jgi:tetratricopeptide (TPR) repeat protein
MATRETPIDRIERLLVSGDADGALQAANAFLAQSPRSFLARIARCRANLRLRNFVDAEADCALALELSPKDEHANLIRANLDHRLGKIDACLERLRPIALGKGPHAVEAAINILDALFYADRNDALREFVKAGGAWTKDPRALLMQARVRVLDDFEGGVADMKAILRSAQPLPLRRVAGFEAVRLLDKKSRFREAFDLAREAHASTGAPFEIGSILAPLKAQVRSLAARTAPITERAPRVDGCAFVVAMPRSGTTLLEQMLDRHPAIGGIGEFDGLDALCRALDPHSADARFPENVPADVLKEAQRRYLEGARQIRKEGARWTFDKTLRTWRCLPQLAAAMPGAVCINVERDPRDMATSIFLSFFNPVAYAWTQGFESIRRVIEVERELVPVALANLGLSHESIVYENLVEDPRGHAERCLSRMGLEMDERVLAPEGNTRGAFTLSHAQVRQPINRSSIGRWRNYEWAFDASWEPLVAAHERRIVTPAKA